MKISYVLQLKDFFFLFIIGLFLGVFYGIINIIPTIKYNVFFQILADLIFSISAFIIITISINIVNLGEFRMFLLVGIISGFVVERITLGKIFAKGYKKMYTNIVRSFKKFSQTNIGRIIFK